MKTYRSKLSTSGLRNSPPGQRARTDFQPLRSQVEREYAELNLQNPRLLRLTLNEAEALAVETEVPALVYPVLAAEKAHALSRWQTQQYAIRANGPFFTLAE